MNIDAIIAALMQDGEAFKCTIECERHSITILGAKKTTVVNVTVPPPVTPETLWRPIPKNIFYHPPSATFRAASGKICEVAFLNTWLPRAKEFPVWMGRDVRATTIDSIKLKMPIPKYVYYDSYHDTFYSAKASMGVGSDFYIDWKARCQDFPTKAEECT
jgi:hypothetical protein